MNVFKATLDTRYENGVIGPITQFDNATLELQVLTDGVIDEAWDNPRFELIAMKRDANEVREVDQDRFTILSKEDHKVQIELKEQFLACRGTVKMQLVIKEGSRLSTTLFYLVIAQSLDHDIVESHRDVKVLDDLEAYVKQGFDDLAYQEQRMVAVEQSTNDLNETMNANEAERNVAETKRSQIFETNETNRTQMFNTQVEKQRIAFSNAQTQREKDFSESQQNMSQEFETSQKERESDFNELQKSNQKTFETNEQKRQTAFNQSQTANQQDFVDNEAERQRLFESNESSRQKSESQRVQNESERVLAETQRADAEVIRQQKIIEFEEKATQLSEDLDSQVARVDEFVTANEEKLLGAHDKTDYMGNAHKSVKDVNDANVEYILGEVNTVHYEGQHITATDTIEKQVRSAILKGNTLVNLMTDYIDEKLVMYYSPQTDPNVANVSMLKPNTEYTMIYNAKYQEEGNYGNLIVSVAQDGSEDINISREYTFSTKYQRYVCKFTTPSIVDCFVLRSNGHYFHVKECVLLEGDHTQEDIPFFTGMSSVKLPVLTTNGKNLYTGEQLMWTIDSNNAITTHGKESLFYFRCKPNTTYTFTTLIGNQYGRNRVHECYEEPKVGTVVTLLKNNISTNTTTITTSANAKYIVWQNFNNDNGTYTLDDLKQNAQIEENSVATSYEPFKSNILSIDGEYRGIGDVCDTVDCMTGEVVERIGEIVLDENITGSNGIIQGTLRRFDITLNKSITEKIISDKFRTGKWNYNLTINTAYEFIGYYNPTTLLLAVESSKLPTQDLSGLKEYLQSNPITVQYELAEPVIKTVDLSGQKVYSYDGTTHYSCSAAEGALVPTLSIDVPTNLPALVSRQRTTIESQKEQIITLEQENEQLIAQNEVQDIDISLNQDAINFMLFAPATMSLNDESRNNEGVNAMAAYLANQILKGKLDYSLVVSRYGTYKEDIDTILIAEGKQDLIK